MPLTLSGTTGVSGIDGSVGTPATRGSDADTGLFYPSAGVAAVATNGTESFRADTSQNLLVGVTSANVNGGVLQLKSGITFPATAVASTDVNTLDDYEEGTWTPTDGSGAGLTFTVYSATYTKIGRVVMFEASIFWPSTASALPTKVSGLPFASASGDDNTGGWCPVGTSAGAFYGWQINRGTTNFTGTTNANSDVTNANMSGKFVKGFGWYHV